MPLDIYSPSFIHGSPAGFDNGCRTKPVCTNFGSNDWLTCVEADAAQRADYRLHREPRTKRIGRAALETPTPHPKPSRPDADEPAATAGRAIAETRTFEQAPRPAPPAERFVAPPPKPKRLPALMAFDDPQFPHGTTAGYSRGCCKNGAVCPGNNDGKTCKEASADYQREYAAKKAAGKATTPAKPRAKKPESGPPLDHIESAPTTPEQAPDPGEAMEAGPDSAPADASQVDPAPPAEGDDLEIAEMCLICKKTGPVNFECPHPDAHTPVANSTHDANGEPYFYDDEPDQASTVAVAGEPQILTTEQWQRAILEASTTGGGTATVAIAEPARADLAHDVADLALTIDPTDHAGVRIGLSLPALGPNNTLTIQVALAASSGPGLGNLQITVGSAPDARR